MWKFNLKRSALSYSSGLLALCMGLSLWIFAQFQNHRAARFTERDLETAVAVPLQIIFSGGDRYLASNVGAWRATMLGGAQLKDFSLNALTKIQEDASWLNPAHEDNYYTATAVLPWEGYVQPTQTILRRAMLSRRGDPFPSFYYGFNVLNFEGNPHEAARALEMAAREVDDNGAKIALFEMAARWERQGSDPGYALKVLRKAAQNARKPSLKVYLERQLLRLDGLYRLQNQINDYTKRYGYPPSSLQDLVSQGIVTELQNDPVGSGYGLRDGAAYLLSPRRE